MNVLWAVLAASLAVFSFLTFLIMVWAVFAPKVIISRGVLIGNSIAIGSTGAIAYEIWAHFLR